MKKRKMTLIVTLIIIMQVSMMPIVAQAAGMSQVEISIPGYATTYEAYDSITEAHWNKIYVTIKEKDFPVYATIKGSSGNEESYTFDSYGTKELEVRNAKAEDVIVTLLTGPFCILLDDPKAYATIVIEPPQEKEVRSSVTENMESIDLDTKLQPLFEKMDFPQYTDRHYYDEIKDFVEGTWDGEFNSEGYAYVSATRYIFNRTYHWKGFNSLDGKHYNDIDINIDYLGTREVVTGKFFTLTVDYDAGSIEKWRLLEKEDAWEISGEGESISKIFPLTEKDCQAIVYTIDETAQEHMYFLMPNGNAKKIN